MDAYVPPKHWLTFHGLYGVKSQNKYALYIQHTGNRSLWAWPTSQMVVSSLQTVGHNLSSIGFLIGVQIEIV